MSEETREINVNFNGLEYKAILTEYDFDVTLEIPKEHETNRPFLLIISKDDLKYIK